MLFNSLSFLFFFPIVTTVYFLLPHRFRWALLLFASVYFYAFFIPKYILILFLLIFVDYFAGICIGKSAEAGKRKLFLVVSILANLSILGFFKYFNFTNSNLSGLFHALGMGWLIPHLDIILPIGLSFHTFQSLSYTIEVYRGKQAPETNFGIYALYVMFYPQLVAGPIERPQNLLHQFYEKHTFDFERVTDGLRLMAWGLFKKVVIADRLSIIADSVYNHPHGHSGAELILATYFFSIQIYCDFSGYSDIAIGAARVMGITLMTNFRRPYFATSIAEFWKRWHVSLSTWFRDYLYIPLGGNRVSIPRWYLNLFIVFVVSGFWHGANWTFMVWGALHGSYLIASILTVKVRNAVKNSLSLDNHPIVLRLIQTLVVFHLATFAWIFFRASDMNDALYVIGHLFSPGGFSFSSIERLGLTVIQLIVGLISVGILLIVDIVQHNEGLIKKWESKPAWSGWVIWYAALFYLINFGMFNNPAKFIYFQF